MGITAVSYGAGVQSTALLVLAASGRIDFRTFLFANVGNDSEHPATLAYLREVAAPFAASSGLELVELARVPTRGRHAGEVETLWGRLTRADSRSIPIPVRMSSGEPGTRSCTADFKVRVVGRELRRRGASRAEPATVALGISVDEVERARPGVDARSPDPRLVYPLLDLGLTRPTASGSSRMPGCPSRRAARAGSVRSIRPRNGAGSSATTRPCSPGRVGSRATLTTAGGPSDATRCGSPAIADYSRTRSTTSSSSTAATPAGAPREAHADHRPHGCGSRMLLAAGVRAFPGTDPLAPHGRRPQPLPEQLLAPPPAGER